MVCRNDGKGLNKLNNVWRSHRCHTQVDPLPSKK